MQLYGANIFSSEIYIQLVILHFERCCLLSCSQRIFVSLPLAQKLNRSTMRKRVVIIASTVSHFPRPNAEGKKAKEKVFCSDGSHHFSSQLHDSGSMPVVLFFYNIPGIRDIQQSCGGTLSNKTESPLANWLTQTSCLLCVFLVLTSLFLRYCCQILAASKLLLYANR